MRLHQSKKESKKKTDSFEGQLLRQLEKKMSENEMFGLSVGLGLDKMPRKMASKCKEKIMQVIAELEEETDYCEWQLIQYILPHFSDQVLRASYIMCV